MRWVVLFNHGSLKGLRPWCHVCVGVSVLIFSPFNYGSNFVVIWRKLGFGSSPVSWAEGPSNYRAAEDIGCIKMMRRKKKLSDGWSEFVPFKYSLEWADGSCSGLRGLANWIVDETGDRIEGKRIAAVARRNRSASAVSNCRTSCKSVRTADIHTCGQFGAMMIRRSEDWNKKHE